MKRMKKIISAALAASMLISSVTAFAKPLVHVSPWAYNDVSVFEQENLATPAFDDISDYRVNITRGQFAELVANVLDKTDSLHFYGTTSKIFDAYDDIGDNTYYKTLIIFDIMTGEIEKTETAVSEYDPNVTYEKTVLAHFYPDRELTRQEAAAIVSRALSDTAIRNIPNSSGKELTYADTAQIADWALDRVATLTTMGLMRGVDGNRFDPTGSITIEQAMTMLYRMFRMIPTVPKPDGDGVDAKTETTIQEYDNGYVETKLDNKLYVKKGGLSIPFDTDIYSNIFCVTASDGKNYCVAKTFDNSTDLFSADTGEYMKSMRVIMQSADSDYIITRSTKKGQCAFGLYDYAGNEVLPAKYSLAELDEYRETGGFPDDSYQAPDGWVYYADWEDGGHMYKVDSNGENKQKISDEDCYNISYYDGWLYYHIRGEYEDDLFCMKTDGTDVTKLSEGYCDRIETDLLYYADGTRVSADDEQNHPYILYIDDSNCDTLKDYSDTERVPERVLYRLTHENGGTQKEKVTDISVTHLTFLPAEKGGKTWAYFLDAKRCWSAGGHKENDWGSSPLYRTDGEVVECVNEDVLMEDFGFVLTPEGETLINVRNGHEYVYNEHGGMERINYREHYIADLNLNKIEDYDEDKSIYLNDYLNDNIISSEISANNKTLENVEKIPKLSDDKYTVYEHSKSVLNNSEYGYYTSTELEYYYTDAAGEKHNLPDIQQTYNACRYGDTIYYFRNSTLCSFDMNTGEDTVIAGELAERNTLVYDYNHSGVYVYDYCNFPLSSNSPSSCGTFCDRDGNVWKCDFTNGGAISEIYPNGSTSRYGKPMYLIDDTDGKTLIKIDADGNYSTILTDVHVKYAIYVPNGDNDCRYGYLRQYELVGVNYELVPYEYDYDTYMPYYYIYDLHGTYKPEVYDKTDEFYDMEAKLNDEENQ